MNKTTVTYEPDNSLKKGYFNLIREIIDEIGWNKWLTFQLFKRDLSTAYKQSFIGILWIFIIPVVNVAVFALLNRSGIFNFGQINVPYPLYAILGMAFWQLFASGISSAGSALTNAGEMLTRINFSKKSLILASLGKPVVSCFIQFILVVILFAVYRIMPSKGMILAPLVLIPIIFLTLGLGFLVALLNAVMRDTGNLLSVSLTFLMYLTPVLYARPLTGALAHITRYNPMYYFVAAGRDLILKGTIIEWQGFLVSTLFSIVLLLVSLLIFHLTETRIAERI